MPNGKLPAKEMKGALSYTNCHLVALFFVTLELTWQKHLKQNEKDTLNTALVEDLHLRGWNVDYTNHVAYKVSRSRTNATPVMFTMYCCMI